MKTTIITTKKVEIKKDYFYDGQSSLTDERAVELAELRPVLVRVLRKVNDKGEFIRAIEVRTRVYGKLLGYCNITENLIGGRNYIEKTFATFDEAEDWVGDMLENISKKREAILKNVEENKKADADETFIIV
jgi:hypothetical protein